MDKIKSLRAHWNHSSYMLPGVLFSVLEQKGNNSRTIEIQIKAMVVNNMFLLRFIFLLCYGLCPWYLRLTCTFLQICQAETSKWKVKLEERGGLSLTDIQYEWTQTPESYLWLFSLRNLDQCPLILVLSSEKVTGPLKRWKIEEYS